MNLKLFYAILLTLLPISELRIGLPIAISYALEQGIPISSMFFIIVILNILVIFFIFWFLDNLHSLFMNWPVYNKGFNLVLKRFQKKIDRFEKRYDVLGFIALFLLVSIPLPGTGAWTGSLIAWVLGLDRKKSILSIALGVLVAGLIILAGTLSVISLS